MTHYQPYDKIDAATTEAADLIKNSYSKAVKGMQDYNNKIIEFAHANTNAAFDFVQKLPDFRQGQGHYPKSINCSQRSGIVGLATNVAYFQARLRIWAVTESTSSESRAAPLACRREAAAAPAAQVRLLVSVAPITSRP